MVREKKEENERKREKERQRKKKGRKEGKEKDDSASDSHLFKKTPRPGPSWDVTPVQLIPLKSCCS